MKCKLSKFFLLTVTTCIMLVTVAMGMTASAADGKWIGAWGTGITEIGVGGYNDIGVIITKMTCRSVLTPTASGSKMRIRLSNVYGKTDLVINRMTVAKSAGSSKIDTNTVVPVYFDGVRNVTVPAGKELYSDPIDYKVRAMEPLSVSTYISQANEIRSAGFSGGYSYLSIGGNYTSSETMGFACIKMEYGLVSVVPVISSIDVYSEEEDAYSVVVIGDSTVANEFPYYLAKQINDRGYSNVGIVGKGIIGNSLLSDGFGIGEKIYGDSLMNRFNIDALSQSGVKYVILKIGCNDIIHPKSGTNAEDYGVTQPTVQEMIDGYTELARRCHSKGIKIICLPLMQWKGYDRDFFGTGAQYTFSDEDWELALKVNEWLSTTDVFDDYVNLIPYSVDPDDSARMQSQYTEDGCHPNDALQILWSQKFPLEDIGVVVKPKNVQLNRAIVSYATGKLFKLTATITPANAVDKRVKWTSSNTSVAIVNPNGYVKCVAPGRVLITCTTVLGGEKAAALLTVYRPATGVSLSRTALSMYATQAYTLKATVLPSDAANKSVKWTSSNSAVASVNSAGRVTAVKAGSAVITCTTVDGSFVAKCTVRVAAKVAVTKVALSHFRKTVIKDSSFKLTASVYPANASIKTFTWSSSNTAVATVSSTGVVTGIRGGKAVITCKSRDNGIYDTCEVVIKCYPNSLTLSRSAAAMYVGRSFTLTSTVLPSDATNKNVTWSSSDRSVATVSSTGVVKGIKAGTVIITCKTAERGLTATCRVTVKKIIYPTSVKLNTTSRNIYIGNTYTLVPTVYPTTASSKAVRWASSNTSVATVSSKGVVTAKKIGNCTITCTTVYGAKRTSCAIRVTAVPTRGVTLNRTGASIYDGKTVTLIATVTPANASNKKVTWVSSNISVATVSASGVVTGQYPGTCTITAKTASGGYTAKCTVRVVAVKVTGVKLNTTSVKVGSGGTVRLTAVVSPSNATNKALRWSSSNAAIAKVSSTGVVTGVGGGKALIGCQTVDGGFIAMCVVEVTAVPVLGVKLNHAYLNLAVGRTSQLTATVLPSNAGNKSVSWSSNNTKVAKVSSTGLVTAVGRGTAVITVKTADGSWTATCKIVVS